MKDWLSDPLMVFDKEEGVLTPREPDMPDEEGKNWRVFHFATRSKLEGAVHFCRQLLGVASLPSDLGLPNLAYRQRGWCASAFFFLLCSAYDTLLQEVNVIYVCDLPFKDVRWSSPRRKEDIRRKLSEKDKTLCKKMQDERDKDWFKKVMAYRNTATHRYLIPMGESALHGTEEAEVHLIYVDEETNGVQLEEVKVCKEYLTRMRKHIRMVWSEMERRFKPVER